MGDDAARDAMDAETAKAKEKQGTGTVPNVTEEDTKNETGKLKEPIHEYEETKGDWSKTGG